MKIASVAFSAWAQAAPRATTPLGRTAKFLGVWNYRTPEPKIGLNIAAVSGSGFSEDFPQVGWIDFTQDPDGEVTGRTDQGCTWQFDLKSGELQLAFPGQTCFNRVIGSRYRMNRWTVSVTGNGSTSRPPASCLPAPLISPWRGEPERRSTRTRVKTWPGITPATGRSFRRTRLPGSTWKRSSGPAGRRPSRR